MIRVSPWSLVKIRENAFKKCGGLWRVVEGDYTLNPIILSLILYSAEHSANLLL